MVFNPKLYFGAVFTVAFSGEYAPGAKYDFNVGFTTNSSVRNSISCRRVSDLDAALQ